jgi:hypothetical protein
VARTGKTAADVRDVIAIEQDGAECFRPHECEMVDRHLLIYRSQNAQEMWGSDGSFANVRIRDFIAQFRGMSATEGQKLVLRELGAADTSLHQFFGSELNHERMKKLLGLVQKHTRPVRPELLGVIGEEHFRRLTVAGGGEEQSFKYPRFFGHHEVRDIPDRLGDEGCRFASSASLSRALLTFS